jgi:hypothetical protein
MNERDAAIIAAIAAPLTIAIWLGMSIGDGLANMEARNAKLRVAWCVHGRSGEQGGGLLRMVP